MTTTTNDAQTETARAALFRKIRALLAKTTEKGCTEAEALAATSLARRLMDEYNVAHSDLNEPEEPWATQDFTTQTTRRKRDWRLREHIAGIIGRYADCRTIHELNATGTVTYFGREGDVLFAGWLLETLSAFGERAWGLFEAAQSFADTPLTDAPDRESFLHGYASRIKDRMHDEIALRAAPSSSGSALIVRRNTDRDIEAKRRWPHLTRYRPTSSRVADATSLAAGAAAGGRIGFHRPVAGNAGGPILVGRR